MPLTRASFRTLLAGALLAWGPDSSACSLGEGYLRPSNYALVKATPTILLATAVSADPGAPPDRNRPATVGFDVREVVKGTFAGKTLQSQGDAARYDGPSPPNAFGEPRPGAGRGACNAYDYRLGTTYLLFLSGAPGAITGIVDGPPFSRINEEASEGSPWLTAVRHYVRIAALGGGAAERKALLALQAQAKASGGDPRYPLALGADIEQHLTVPNNGMSYAELLAIYRKPGVDEDTQASALWAMADPPKPEARALFASLVQSGGWRTHAGPTEFFIKGTKDRALTSRLLGELPTVEDQGLRWRILQLASELAGASEQPHMLRAARNASDEQLVLLSRWFVRHPSPAGTALLRRALKPPYEENWDLAFAVASLGDADVLAWGQKMAESQHEKRWVGLYVIAHSPLPRADELARGVIRRGDAADVANLVDGYEDSTNPHLWDRLADAIALTPRPERVDNALRRTLRKRVEAGDARAVELLKAAVANSKFKTD